MTMGAAQPRVLPATPGHFRQPVGVQVIVDGGNAGFQQPGHPLGAVQILAPDRRGQRQVGIIGHGDGFILGGKLHHRNHRAEGFIADQQHVLGGVHHQGGGVEVPVLRAHRLRLRHDAGAFFHSLVHMLAHGVELAAGGHGAHVYVKALAHAMTQRFGFVDHQLHEFVVHRFMHVNALDTAAGLARILVTGPGRSVGGPFQIRIFKHQHGIIAAQFQRQRGEGFRRLLHQLLAHVHRAGEENLVDALFEKGIGHRTASAHDLLEQALGQIGCVDDAVDGFAHQRRGGGDFQQDRVAGNAILLKVAAATPLVGEAINRIIDAANLPKGLFQQIVGAGGAVSNAFFEQRIDKIFFTGSVDVGKQLMEQASKTLTPLSLELGGNDPMLVFEDADLERATNGAAWAGYQNAGQSCGGVERVYVHESVYDKFMQLMIDKTKALRHGVGQGFNVDVGSMTTRGQLNTVRKHVDEAVKKGARIVAQSQPVGPQNGHFYPATLMVDTTEDMLLIRDETFGPVIPVMKFATEDEAIAMANNSHLALTSSIWSKDLDRAKRVAGLLESGVTTINDHLYTHGLSEMPWGGWKHSGLGRTHGHEGLLEMTHAKAINWDIIPSKRNIWWYPFNEETYNGLLNAQRFVYPRDAKEFVSSAAKLTPFLVKKMFTRWKT